MRIEACEHYFHLIRHPLEYGRSRAEKILTALAIFSCFSLIVPVSMGALYGFFTLANHVKHKALRRKMRKIRRVANQTGLQKPQQQPLKEAKELTKAVQIENRAKNEEVRKDPQVIAQVDPSVPVVASEKEAIEMVAQRLAVPLELFQCQEKLLFDHFGNLLLHMKGILEKKLQSVTVQIVQNVIVIESANQEKKPVILLPVKMCGRCVFIDESFLDCVRKLDQDRVRFIILYEANIKLENDEYRLWPLKGDLKGPRIVYQRDDPSIIHAWFERYVDRELSRVFDLNG